MASFPNIYVVENESKFLLYADALLREFDWLHRKPDTPVDLNAVIEDDPKYPWRRQYAQEFVKKKDYNLPGMWPSDRVIKTFSGLKGYPPESIRYLLIKGNETDSDEDKAIRCRLIKDDEPGTVDDKFRLAEDVLSQAPNGSFLILDQKLEIQIPGYKEASYRLAEVFLAKPNNYLIVASRWQSNIAYWGKQNQVFIASGGFQLENARELSITLLEKVADRRTSLYDLIRYNTGNPHPSWQEVKSILGTRFPEQWNNLEQSYSDLLLKGYKQLRNPTKNDLTFAGLVMIVAIILAEHDLLFRLYSKSANGQECALTPTQHWYLKHSQPITTPITPKAVTMTSEGKIDLLHEFFLRISKPANEKSQAEGLLSCLIDPAIELILNNKNTRLTIRIRFRPWPEQDLPLSECVLYHLIASVCNAADPQCAKGHESIHESSLPLAQLIAAFDLRLVSRPRSEKEKYSFFFGHKKPRTIVRFSKPYIGFSAPCARQEGSHGSQAI